MPWYENPVVWFFCFLFVLFLFQSSDTGDDISDF
jgi:hypothetical protein